MMIRKANRSNTYSPEWISVSDRLPSSDGEYLTIAEAQSDLLVASRETISVAVNDRFERGEWWNDSGNWKVLYWAEPVKISVPAELALRPRLQC